MIGDSLRTRRKLVGLFATAAGALGLGLSRAPAAMAANGDPLVLGQNNYKRCTLAGKRRCRACRQAPAPRPARRQQL
jgi:hypothetical protein